MFLRLLYVSFILICSAPIAHAELVNLRNSCSNWEHIPANDSLQSPIAALLECNDDNGVWLSMQIMCFPKTAEIELRYRPSYPIIAPIPETSLETNTLEVAESSQLISDTLPEIESENVPLGNREMLFFDFPSIGVTNVVTYDETTRDWSYREKEPLVPLFSKLISGNYADITMLAMDTTERLPLRGSTKALRPVVEACRIAKRKLNKAAGN